MKYSLNNIQFNISGSGKGGRIGGTFSRPEKFEECI
jgi:hypothetical protein